MNLTEAILEHIPGAATPQPAASVADIDLPCRVCELETENKRLRLLVGELLVENQRLREEAKAHS